MLGKTVMILPRLFPRGVTLSNPTSLGFGSSIRKRDGSLGEPSSSYSAEKQMSPASVVQAGLEEGGVVATVCRASVPWLAPCQSLLSRLMEVFVSAFSR